MDQNSYLDIAERAYRGVICMKGVGSENEFCANAQKVAERYLKSVVELQEGVDPVVLKSHSLLKLYWSLKDVNYLGIDKQFVSALNNYYFEVSYPGPDYRIVSIEEEEECFSALQHIRDKVLMFWGNTSQMKTF